MSNVVSRDPFLLYIIAASADNAAHQQYLYIYIYILNIYIYMH